MKKRFSLIIGLFTAASGLFAQYGGMSSPMSALNSGDISALNDVRNVNIVYTYNDMGVGAFRKEEDYLSKKCEDISKKKDASACDKFKKDWVDARKARFEPKFELLFNKYGPKAAFMEGTNYSADKDVTLEIHTVFVEPGYNIGISKKPAFVDFECTFKDKSGKSLCVIFIKNAVGSQAMGYDFDVNSRIVESYGIAAKMLTGLIKKERKKKKIKIAK